MNKSKFKGIFTALLTPYDKNGNLNIDSLKKLIEFNIKSGVNGFYVGGSTGEGVLMQREERKELFKNVAEINAGRVTLIGHVGSTSTDEAVALAKSAKEYGYDAVSAVAPFYYGHTYDAIKGYYRDIVNESDMAMVMYNFPLSGGFSLTPEKAQDIMQDERIFAIKHTSQDLFALERFKRMENAPVVFNGYDEMLAGGLIMGADGGIGSTYNFMPDKIVEIYNLFNQGKLFEVMEKQKEVNDIIALLIKYGVMQCEKEVLTQMGIEMGGCKKPFTELSSEGKQAMKVLAKSLTK